MSVSLPLSRARSRQRHRAWLLAAGLTVLAACLWLAITQGAYSVRWADLFEADAGDSPAAQVFWHIRLPRVMMALLAGAALGLAGAVMQGLFRNPLADPALIGINAGAALGAAGFIVLLPMLAPGYAVWLGTVFGVASAMVCAFVGAMVTAAGVWGLARQQGGVHVARLLLVGIAINALAGAGLGLLSHLANDTQLRALTFWLLGSLAPSQWPAVWCVLPLVLFALVLAPRLARPLNALALGEAQATLMGIHVIRLQRQSVALAALSVGAVTAVIGMVGFIGLLAPHAVRLLAGPDHRVVLPGSALLGACLVLLGDTAARTAFAPVELPLGVLTGLIGAPTFLWMLQHRSLSAGAR